MTYEGGRTEGTEKGKKNGREGKGWEGWRLGDEDDDR